MVEKALSHERKEEVRAFYAGLVESIQGKVAIYYGNNKLHHTEGEIFIGPLG